jgi:hypothetical protein
MRIRELLENISTPVMARASGPEWDKNGGKHQYEDDVDEAIPTANYCKTTRKAKMGNSARASCVSRGLTAHRTDKSVLVKKGKHKGKRISIDGVKMKSHYIGGRAG